jgi:hypothetical protein
MKKFQSRMFFLAAAALAAACGTMEKPEPGHGGDTATQSGSDVGASTEGSDKHASHTEKPAAPVGVEAKLEASRAAIDLVFEADAADVKIEVWGVDGLVVTSEKAPVEGRRFARGEKITLSVSFTAPANRADLAVRVRGTFDGKTRDRVRSFTVNPSAPPAQNAPGEVKVGPDGQPVRVMRAE